MSVNGHEEQKMVHPIEYHPRANCPVNAPNYGETGKNQKDYKIL